MVKSNPINMKVCNCGKSFITRLNGYSIYWSDRYARKDPERFILTKEGKQVYHVKSFTEAVKFCLSDTICLDKTRKRLIQLCKEWDRTDVRFLESFFSGYSMAA